MSASVVKSSPSTTDQQQPQQQQQAPQTNIIVEGGSFHCGIHDFRTISLDEWTRHCKETLHTMFGGASCTYCKNPVYFDSLPHVAPGENPGAVCDDCFERFVEPRVSQMKEARTAKQNQPQQEGQATE